VSIKFTPSSMARRRTFFAFSRSGGQPQMPAPVMRMAPNPSRLTARSPPIENVLLMLDSAAAIRSFGKPPATTIAPPVVVALKNFRRVMPEIRPLPICLNLPVSTLQARRFLAPIGPSAAAPGVAHRSVLLLLKTHPLEFAPRGAGGTYCHRRLVND